MAKVVWSEQAYDDLDAILSYLTPRNLRAAEKYVGDIQSACGKLEHFSQAGRKYNNMYRILVVRNHLVFYRINSSNDKVTIVSILDGRRDIGKLVKVLK